ncbi:MAG TPA: porin family protein, partial [Paludibacteraceae bacterium]|nr:porin family protein [Paludibacteraceae bacterium]
MKRFIYSAVMLFFSVSVFSQIDFGVKAGYNSSVGLNELSSVTSGNYNVDSIRADVKNNFQLGVFGRLNFGKIYFQPELLYTMGKKEYTVTLQDTQNQSASYDKVVNISNIEVPLLVGYKVIDLIKMVNVRVFAGPKLTFNAGSSLKFENLKNITAAELEKDVKNAQLGLEAGLGVDVLKFTLDARFNVIKDMYQTKIQDVTVDDFQANTIVISL